MVLNKPVPEEPTPEPTPAAKEADKNKHIGECMDVAGTTDPKDWVESKEKVDKLFKETRRNKRDSVRIVLGW